MNYDRAFVVLCAGCEKWFCISAFDSSSPRSTVDGARDLTRYEGKFTILNVTAEESRILSSGPSCACLPPVPLSKVPKSLPDGVTQPAFVGLS